MKFDHDVFHGAFFEVVEDENRAQFGAQAADEIANEGTFFGGNDGGFRIGRFSEGFRRRNGGEGFSAIAGKTAIIGRALNGNDEEPRTGFAGGVEIVNTIQSNGENFLGHVIGVACRDPVALDRAPNEFAMFGVKTYENLAFAFGGHGGREIGNGVTRGFDGWVVSDDGDRGRPGRPLGELGANHRECTVVFGSLGRRNVALAGCGRGHEVFRKLNG